MLTIKALNIVFHIILYSFPCRQSTGGAYVLYYETNKPRTTNASSKMVFIFQSFDDLANSLLR